MLLFPGNFFARDNASKIILQDPWVRAIYCTQIQHFFLHIDLAKTKHIQKLFTADSSVQPFIFPCFSPSSVVTVGLLTVGFAFVDFPGESAAPSCANFSIFRYACACAMPINEGKVWKKYHMWGSIPMIPHIIPNKSHFFHNSWYESQLLLESPVTSPSIPNLGKKHSRCCRGSLGTPALAVALAPRRDRGQRRSRGRSRRAGHCGYSIGAADLAEPVLPGIPWGQQRQAAPFWAEHWRKWENILWVIWVIWVLYISSWDGFLRKIRGKMMIKWLNNIKHRILGYRIFRQTHIGWDNLLESPKHRE